ncbi:hypothetical protein B5E56_13085 [Flavonifractor sp. An112]|uniref:hypothetical protein n=1 Tax=Flavonifractor sp. An112 TaxID=1965544 RepID=UPI000B3AA91A|nr:hypothetical protein [Flavonifractor sp. An112]OUQ56406.1 hypothetical protein B5E56_13085 [Flavonifractor sp. An112]
MNQRLYEIDQAIEALTAAQARRKQLDAQIEELHRQRGERQAKVDETAQSFRKEQDDVDKLEKGGVHAFLLTLIGHKEERLDKERREALAAKLQYDQARSDLEYLENKLNGLIRERDGLRDAPEQLEALWTEKAELVKAMGGQTGARLVELDRQLSDVTHQQKELEEALSAGENAKRLLGQVQDDLDSARSWGTWDMLGGGLIATMAKYDRLDSAQSSIRAAQRALSDFRTELADVSQLQVPNIQIGEFATFADYFFDGIFSDWYVQSSIKKAQEGVSEVHMKLTAALRDLEAASQDLNDQQASLKREREDLLDSVSS